jgi:phosphodiesterase/alkaline phosphatase D-like protein
MERWIGVLALVFLASATMTTTSRAQQAWNSVTLTWTTPGDDSLSGTASQFDVRYSTSAITGANFSSATRWTSGVPAPAAPGTQQTVTVTGLSPSTTYWFAIKTADEVPNWSVISNVASRTTSPAPDTTPPAAITNLTLGLSWMDITGAAARPPRRSDDR